ncbi:MAG: aspartate aminotransferase family protein [Acidobacteria bacterium]|nr:aspartate aminotransferase family protein [Acidobacteriota bacterium]
MLSAFPAPYRSESDPLPGAIADAVRRIDELRPEPLGPAFLGSDPSLSIDFDAVKRAAIPAAMADPADVVRDVVNLFQGAPNWGHPLTMCNVVPQPNTVAIIASMLAQVYSLNILEGEYAWNVHRAELESAAMLAGAFGWDPARAGGIYTYGGSGCWTYAVKYGLTRVLRGSRQRGVRTDAKVLCSQQAHYTMQNSTDWTGLGMDNVIRIRTDVDTNAMDLAHLEEVLRDLTARAVPIAAVVCTMGTTDANAFDPADKVRALLDRHPNAEPYGPALLYCDAVVGWSWALFRQYDFDVNPLGFSDDALALIRRVATAASTIQHADAVGVDFHKVGWTPYGSSVFVYRDADEFQSLLSRPLSPYLQARSPYNPLDYTLEVSRPATGSLAGWATLRYLGLEGFQSILGGIMETKAYLRRLLFDAETLVCANPDDYGLCTLFRAYPRGVDGNAQFERELTDPSARDALIRHNQLTRAIGDRLWEWFRAGKRIDGLHTPYISFSTGFRVTEYNRDAADPDAVVFALKIFPMNVHIHPKLMRHVLDCVLAARDEVMEDA